MNCLRNMTYVYGAHMAPWSGMHWISKHRNHANHVLCREVMTQFQGQFTMNHRYVRLVDEIISPDPTIADQNVVEQLQELTRPTRADWNVVSTITRPTAVFGYAQTVDHWLRVATNIEDFVTIYKSQSFRFVLVRGLILPGRSLCQRHVVFTLNEIFNDESDGSLSDEEKHNLFDAASCCLRLVETIHDRLDDPGSDVSQETIISRFKPQSITNILQFAIPIARAWYVHHGQDWRPSESLVRLHVMAIVRHPLPALQQNHTAPVVPQENFVIPGPTVNDLEQDYDAGPGEALCVLCRVRAAICLDAPCDHLAYCVRCARTYCQLRAPVIKCPVSRTPLTSIRIIFFPLTYDGETE